jgi:hypothetical protein
MTPALHSQHALKAAQQCRTPQRGRRGQPQLSRAFGSVTALRRFSSKSQ